MAGALVVRRRHPVPVFAVVALAALGQVLLGFPLLPQDVAVPVALYTVIKYAVRLRWAWLAAGVTAVGCVLATQPWRPNARLAGVVFLLVFSAAVAATGASMRTRRLYVRSLEERAATLERERDQRARLAVADERARIARELHDVVAHSLAVMIVQADGASYTFDTDPETAREAVRTVAGTGREALAEMRRLVEVLRSEREDQAAGPAIGPDSSEARQPVGLDRLDPLLARSGPPG